MLFAKITLVIGESLLIGTSISLLLMDKRFFYSMPLDLFLMYMCVVVIALLIEREIKLTKAR